VKVEVVAIGTELLLGQIVDTNGAWLGEQLALAGVDSHFRQIVGDNHTRIVEALRAALERSDGVIICGGLGPTQDDLTREALAEVLGVPLRRDPALIARIEEMFASRGRAMAENNLRQADVPEGATVIPQTLGTAPGLLCPTGSRVLYAVPGVPYEMQDMFTRGILPDLRDRMAARGEVGVIASRVLRVWGTSESRLAELLAPRLAALDAEGSQTTLAFLASGIEGLKVRITTKAPDLASAAASLAAEEAEVSALVGPDLFGVDGETMESAVGRLLVERGWDLALAESLTGGLVASRIVDVPGASAWFRGCVVSYASEVKWDLLHVPEGPVVGQGAARAMAEGARRALGADVGLALTGVAGPGEQEGQPVGTVFVGVVLPGQPAEAVDLRVPGDRARVRQYATISALDLLRRRLAALR
jgi:nicotinamide-nucleotide amidase